MNVSSSILVAARRWLIELNYQDESRARIALGAVPGRRDITPTQYEIALEWIKSNGLYPRNQSGTPLVPSAGAIVLAAAIETATPPWLADADSLVQSPDDIPIDVAELGVLLDLDPTEMFDVVRRAWHKFDDTARRQLGLAGELAFVEWLQRHTVAQVVHISMFDDSAGYDMALTIEGRVCARVEVKSTRREDSARIYLSRNEVETMLVYSSWCLQLVQLDASNALRKVSWVSRESILSGVPLDGSRGSWQSMRMTLSQDILRPGLAPQIASAVRGQVGQSVDD